MRILLFLKAPRPGLVKTRLAKTLGETQATVIYRKLVEHTLLQIPQSASLEIHFSPGDAEAEMRQWLGEDRTYIPQQSGDLGDRLQGAVNTAFLESSDPVCCIGADCPGLKPEHFELAEAAIDQGADVVFGPAEDGGYYLIALKAVLPAVFTHIPWSAPDTLKASQAQVVRSGKSFQNLETLTDVDEVADWEKTEAQVQTRKHPPSHY